MSVKLIKTIDEQGAFYVLSGKNLPENYVLSDKNCQAIECGYDLNELAEKHINYEPHTVYILQRKFDFIDGFRKALGILGDKRFTDKDLDKAIEYGHESRMPFNEDWYNEFIQSLQQTEWEVEIEMEQVYDGLDEMAQPQYYKQPKFDADGCLILKRL